MKTFTFIETVMLDESEFSMLREISSSNYLLNYEGPAIRLELCDSLVGKGLCSEDTIGRISITNRGKKFLENAM